MIDTLFKTLAATWHRHWLIRQTRKILSDNAFIMAWNEANPHECVICAYTCWANDRGARLGAIKHHCIEAS